VGCLGRSAGIDSDLLSDKRQGGGKLIGNYASPSVLTGTGGSNDATQRHHLDSEAGRSLGIETGLDAGQTRGRTMNKAQLSLEQANGGGAFCATDAARTVTPLGKSCGAVGMVNVDGAPTDACMSESIDLDGVGLCLCLAQETTLKGEAAKMSKGCVKMVFEILKRAARQCRTQCGFKKTGDQGQEQGKESLCREQNKGTEQKGQDFGLVVSDAKGDRRGHEHSGTRLLGN
jgi:hypothetical protein